jgi:DNA transposition AAA+ family ATPase
MSGTRHAEPGSDFRPERYASSPNLERGFNAVLVKLRCETLSNEKDIELAWFLQYLSTLPGGMTKVAQDILDASGERLGTPEMHQIGIEPKGIYNANHVQAVRHHFSIFSHNEFLLRNEKKLELSIFIDSDLSDSPGDGFAQITAEIRKKNSERERKRATESNSYPTSYPVAKFLDVCRDIFFDEVPNRLTKFCLDPGFSIEQLNIIDSSYQKRTVFRDLHGALIEYMERWERNRLANIVVTAVGKKVLDALDYAEAEKSLVLVEGPYGTGKTFITKAWCEARPGKRRYIQAPSSNDNLDFFRTVAEPIGVSHALSLKAQQMRARINGVLQAGHLTVVIDEAHYLFPQASARVAMPGKINWILTALTNYEVPVALVATPQFTAAQATVEKNTHWASGQFIGRISRYVKLPDSLDETDLAAIARFHLPNGDAKSIEALVVYAQASKKRIRGIEHGIKAARHVARSAGREQITLDDIKRAMRESVMPSDTALDQALFDATTPTQAKLKRRGSKVYATPLQEPLRSLSAPVPERVSRAVLTVELDAQVGQPGPASLSSA